MKRNPLEKKKDKMYIVCCCSWPISISYSINYKFCQINIVTSFPLFWKLILLIVVVIVVVGD